VSAPVSTVLLVTKPVAPPWSDGTRNLVHALLAHREREVQLRVPVPRGQAALPFANLVEEAIYPDLGGHGTGGRNNRAMLKRLLGRAQADAIHFLFAPTPTTGRILRVLLAPRRLPTIHTVCSRPRSFEHIKKSLFARHHVALSHDTAQRLESAGVGSVAHLDPGVMAPVADAARGRAYLETHGLPKDCPFFLYAGDLEFNKGAETVIRSLPRGLQSGPHNVVLACREKTPQSRIERQKLETLAVELGVRERVHFFAYLEFFHDVIAAADVMLFPTHDTYAKLDLPLVLLEALALGRPLIVADQAPVGELLDDAVGLAVESENADSLADALEAAIADADRLETQADARCAIFQSRYTADAHAKGMMSLYEQWLA
jgi:phosphatidylinositol alpha-1,6-mannosyltransferase